MPKGKRQSPQKRQGRAEKRQDSRPGSEERWLYGIHAVLAALSNPARKHRKLLITPEAAKRLETKLSALPEGAVALTMTPRSEIDRRLPPGAVHQGIALDTDPLPVNRIADFVRSLEHQNSALLVALDQISDPQNAGAIIRSAAAFGADGILLTERHSPPLAGALAKAAAGTLESVAIVRVGNLVSAIETLKSNEFWCIGLDGDAQQPLSSFDAAGYGRLVLAIGAEGKGLRRLTREHCDILLRIPMTPRVESLNVASAASIALYALRGSAIDAKRDIAATVDQSKTSL